MSHWMNRLPWRTYWFQVSIAFIAAVSLYDTILIIHFSEVIGSMEENPVGTWLLNAGNGSVWVFVRCKIAGTLIVLLSLLAMWLYQSRLVFPVTTSVASWQAALFIYLTAA